MLRFLLTKAFEFDAKYDYRRLRMYNLRKSTQPSIIMASIALLLFLFEFLRHDKWARKFK